MPDCLIAYLRQPSLSVIYQVVSFISAALFLVQSISRRRGGKKRSMPVEQDSRGLSRRLVKES